MYRDRDTLRLMHAHIPPLHERLRALREERHLSQPDLFKLAHGVGFDTIRGVESPPDQTRSRYPSPDTLKAILEAMDVDPLTFPEYRLALAREQLDERKVGLTAALELLQRVEEVLVARPRARRADAPAASGRRRSAATRP